MPASSTSARAKILEYLLRHVGEVVDGETLREVSGNISEWGRRVRELRDELGYDIHTHTDTRELRPGQYMLVSRKRRPAFERGISKETRARVLERNGSTCMMCGAAAGDDDPFHPGRTIRLTIGHIVDKSKGGTDDLNNLRAECTNCNEGLQNTSQPKPRQIDLMKGIRRASLGDQKAVLDWLAHKFKGRR
jgi:hypothetical protein